MRPAVGRNAGHHHPSVALRRGYAAGAMPFACRALRLQRQAGLFPPLSGALRYHPAGLCRRCSPSARGLTPQAHRPSLICDSCYRPWLSLPQCAVDHQREQGGQQAPSTILRSHLGPIHGIDDATVRIAWFFAPVQSYGREVAANRGRRAWQVPPCRGLAGIDGQ